MKSQKDNLPIIIDERLLEHLALASADKIPLSEVHDWNQRQRDRWVEDRAKSVLSGSTVLDVGAGTCPYRKLFAHCAYHTHDFKQYEGPDFLKREENDISDGYGKIDFVSDINSLPVRSASYDVVLCTEVFEHIPEPIIALQEIARVMCPGGKLLLTAPLASGLHQLPYHFYGGFTPEWYKKFCAEMGLEILSIEPLGGYFKLLSQECARFAWTIDQHRDLHGDRADKLSKLFADTLARYFYALDALRPLETFTAGYVVEAQRISDIEHLQKLIDNEPTNVRLFVAAARLALDTNDFERAESFIEDLLELEPGSAIGQKLKATLHGQELIAK